jgi:hypothetical protein
LQYQTSISNCPSEVKYISPVPKCKVGFQNVVPTAVSFDVSDEDYFNQEAERTRQNEYSLGHYGG